MVWLPARLPVLRSHAPRAFLLPPAVPQGRPLEARRIQLPPLFIFHHANAYEADGGSKLVVDSIHYESLPAVGREALADQQVGGRAAAGPHHRWRARSTHSHSTHCRLPAPCAPSSPRVTPGPRA